MKKTLLAAMAMVSLCGYAQIPVEGFESPWTGTPAAPPGWVVVNEHGPVYTWVQSTDPGSPPYGGNHAAFMNKENVPSGNATPKDWLISPAVNVPVNANNFSVKFFSRLTISGDQGGIYKVLVGTNPANLSSFTELYSATELEINPVQTEYTEKLVGIPATYAGTSVHIAFVMEGDDADRWLIDDVSMINACQAPANLTATNITATSATLNWTETGDATSWEIDIVSETSVPTGIGFIHNGTLPVTVTTTTNGSPFAPNTSYKYYVRAICQDGGQSPWVGPFYFSNSTCPVPTGITISESGLNSVTYTWDDMGAATYDYLLTTSTLPPGNIPTGNTASNTATLVNLQPGVDYYFYVRSHCVDGGISPWSASYPEIPAPIDNNILTGKVTYDTNGDGVCDEGAAGIPYVEVQVTANGGTPYSVYTNDQGEYKLYSIEDGVTNLSLQVVAPQYFTPAAPLVQDVTFSVDIDAVTITHCLTQPSAASDLSVLIVPVGSARPGLPAIYRIIAHNAGSTVQDNVMLNLSFDDTRITYAASEYANTIAAEANLAINLGTIQPFSVKNGDITFNVMMPPVNIGGEVLHFDAVLTEVTDDVTPENNTSVLNQTIVNSYDPNDITVHEGAEIFEDQADDYLTYTIRFQNTGTAEAIDIKLENTLDALLDWETFKPLVSSHNYTVKRTDDFLEFEYDKIHLPDSTSNEPASHGYITYKIKPKAGFGLNDIIYNTAEIYFDFNPAIVTNTATTKVIALAGLNDNKIAVARLYPNPVKDQLMIDVVNGELKSVTINDVNGRLCVSANANVIDTDALTGGIYFVKVTTDTGSANYKIIKR